MTNTLAMIQSTPSKVGFDPRALADAIDAVFACAQTCTACADACLGEESGDLARCITSDLNCADVCSTTGRVLSRQTEYDATLTKAQLAACVAACQRCAEECEQHAGMHEHCRICAETCRRCEQACQHLLSAA